MTCLLQITLVAYLFYKYRLALQLTDIQYAIKQRKYISIVIIPGQKVLCLQNTYALRDARLAAGASVPDGW